MTETKIGCVQHDCEKCKALEAQVNTCGSGAGCLHKDARIEALTAERDAALARIAELTYASTQATKCACCGVHKHTPLRVDFMGGYVCLTCIDMRLEVLDDTANLYAKQVAHWIAKHDALLEQQLASPQPVQPSQARELTIAQRNAEVVRLMERPSQARELSDALKVIRAQKDWIMAVPADTVLPAMPGLDRDWADNVEARIAAINAKGATT